MLLNVGHHLSIPPIPDYPDSLVLLHEPKIVDSPLNPHLKFANLRDHGFMVLELDHKKASATWKFVETLKEPNQSIKETRTVWVNDGEVKLRQ